MSPHGNRNADTDSTITFGHLNLAGWTENNNELRKEILLNENCDVYSICETHLSTTSTFVPSLNGYELVRHDRAFVHRNAPKTWGGVGFLIKHELLKDYEYNVVDKCYEGILAIELIHKLIGTKVLIVANYLPPEYSPYGRNATAFYTHLTNMCYSIITDYDRVVFSGDFNARIGHMADSCSEIDIDLPKRIVLDEKDNNHGKGFIEFLLDNKLCVANGRFDPKLDNYTYIGRGLSVVDYIVFPHDQLKFCNDFEVITSKDIVNKYNLHHLIGEKSKPPDHSLLKVKIKVAGLVNENTNLLLDTAVNNVTYNVSKLPESFMNTEETRLELLALIDQLELNRESQGNVNVVYDQLLSCLFKEMDNVLPKNRGIQSSKKLKIKKPYWSDELKVLWKQMCDSENEYLKYKGSNQIRQLLRHRFKESSRIFNRTLRRAERAYNRSRQDEIETVCTSNPTEFWNYIKKLGPRTSNKIPEEVYDDDNNIMYDRNSVLNKWKNEFENLYKSDDKIFDDDFYNEILGLLRNAENNMNDPLYTDNQMLNRNITIEEINVVVDRLKNRKAPGIDRIPNEVLKSDSVKMCLLCFFQYYFDTGLLPSCWSNAIIKPIPKNKNNDPRIPLNYRGINLLSCIYKCYSSVMNRRLLKYLEQNQLLCDEQNGFREKRSCLEHIFTLHSIIKNRKNESKDTFTAFIDYTKCFDLIDRNILYFKLIQYGIDGKMYRTLKKMYSNTMSCVNINGNFTDWFYTQNGCRQGDVTSPTAFCVLINDLIKELKSS